MGQPYRSFGFCLDPVKDGDIIKLLDALPYGEKSPYIKLAIREKMTNDAKKKQPSS